MLAAASPIQAAPEDVIAQVRPAIVAIGTFQAERRPGFAFRGTGFAVGDGSLVATNRHVLPPRADGTQAPPLAIAIPVSPSKVNVRMAAVVREDEMHDLALLRVSGPPLPTLTLDVRASVREGEALLFTGFPIGGVLGLIPATHRATVAAVTPIALPSASAEGLGGAAIRRLAAGPFAIYQLDATAYPGNSGSPLYDPATGAVVAIVNMVFVKGMREAAAAQPSGIAFAIPAVHLRTMLDGVAAR